MEVGPIDSRKHYCSEAVRRVCTSTGFLPSCCGVAAYECTKDAAHCRISSTVTNIVAQLSSARHTISTSISSTAC